MKRKQNVRNVVSFIMLGALLFQVGCAKTVSTIRPEAHQDMELSLPLTVKMTLKQEIVIHGTHRSKPTTLQTGKISRHLIAWDDEVLSIQTSGRTHRFDFRGYEYEVPIDDIEKIEILKSEEGCVIAGGILSGGFIGGFGAMIGFGIAHNLIPPDYSWFPDNEEGFWLLTDAEEVGMITGYALGSAIGVYLVGTGGNVTGSFSRALLGSVLVSGAGYLLGGAVGHDRVLPFVIFGAPIGATIAFNLTRRHESSIAESETALMNIRNSQMSLAFPRVYFRPDQFGRGSHSQRVNLLRVRF